VREVGQKNRGKKGERQEQSGGEGKIMSNDGYREIERKNDKEVGAGNTWKPGWLHGLKEQGRELEMSFY